MEISEIFKPIKGYEGIYELSEAGTVISIKWKGKYAFWNPHPVGYVDSEGYISCCLRKNGKPKTKRVHVLVAEHFLEAPDDPAKVFVNHKDGDKLNPHVSNLEWVTPLQNLQHAIATGLLKNKGQDNWSSKLTEQQVLEIRQLYHTQSQQDIADRFGIGRRHISDIVNGISWAHLPLEDYTARNVKHKITIRDYHFKKGQPRPAKAGRKKREGKKVYWQFAEDVITILNGQPHIGTYINEAIKEFSCKDQSVPMSAVTGSQKSKTGKWVSAFVLKEVLDILKVQKNKTAYIEKAIKSKFNFFNYGDY